jgi:hypothetical protein
MKKNIKIFQIYYNQETLDKLLPGFIPLNNENSLFIDYFEFYPILNFLRNNTLQDNTWYGFLSPKFYEKTGLNSSKVYELLEKLCEEFDVALLSPSFEQLAYYLNPFEQGEAHHSGMMAMTQQFIDECSLKVSLRNFVTDSSTSAFSNYIIAKKEYWIEWKKIAEIFFEYMERSPELEKKTKYGATIDQYSMKAFIQERLSCLVLTAQDFKVLSLHYYTNPKFFSNGSINGPIKSPWLASDLMKEMYRKTSDSIYLEMYQKLRNDISSVNYSIWERAITKFMSAIVFRIQTLYYFSNPKNFIKWHSVQSSRRVSQTIHLMNVKYRKSSDKKYLEMYYKLRS